MTKSTIPSHQLGKQGAGGGDRQAIVEGSKPGSVIATTGVQFHVNVRQAKGRQPAIVHGSFPGKESRTEHQSAPADACKVLSGVSRHADSRTGNSNDNSATRDPILVLALKPLRNQFSSTLSAWVLRGIRNIGCQIAALEVDFKLNFGPETGRSGQISRFGDDSTHLAPGACGQS